MRTKIIPDPILDFAKRSPYVYGPARKARMAMGRVVPPREVPTLRGRVHFNDFMLEATSPEAVAGYKGGAANVIALIDRSLEAAGRSWADVRTWLDFGCGYGRVLRALLERVEPQRVHVTDVTDVIDEGATFCASEFGVRRVPTNRDITTLRLPEVDFAYAISVITHLPERSAETPCACSGNAVAPGGIFLFTTHGQRSLEHAERYGASYAGEAKEALVRAVAERGIGYIPYRHYFDDDYGMAWHSASYVLDVMAALHASRFELLFHEPHGLDEHQDVFAFRRSG